MPTGTERKRQSRANRSPSKKRKSTDNNKVLMAELREACKVKIPELLLAVGGVPSIEIWENLIARTVSRKRHRTDTPKDHLIKYLMEWIGEAVVMVERKKSKTPEERIDQTSWNKLAKLFAVRKITQPLPANFFVIQQQQQQVDGQQAMVCIDFHGMINYILRDDFIPTTLQKDLLAEPKFQVKIKDKYDTIWKKHPILKDQQQQQGNNDDENQQNEANAARFAKVAKSSANAGKSAAEAAKSADIATDAYIEASMVAYWKAIDARYNTNVASSKIISEKLKLMRNINNHRRSRDGIDIEMDNISLPFQNRVETRMKEIEMEINMIRSNGEKEKCQDDDDKDNNDYIVRLQEEYHQLYTFGMETLQEIQEDYCLNDHQVHRRNVLKIWKENFAGCEEELRTAIEDLYDDDDEDENPPKAAAGPATTEKSASQKLPATTATNQKNL